MPLVPPRSSRPSDIRQAIQHGIHHKLQLRNLRLMTAQLNLAHTPRPDAGFRPAPRRRRLPLVLLPVALPLDSPVLADPPNRPGTSSAGRPGTATGTRPTSTPVPSIPAVPSLLSLRMDSAAAPS